MSLTALKWSMSAMATASGVCARAARVTSTAASRCQAPAFSSPVLASVRAAVANEAWRSDRCSTITRGNATTRATALCAAANAVSTARHSSVPWLQTASWPRARLRSRVPGAAVALTGGRIRQAWMAMHTSPDPAASVNQARAWPPGPAPPPHRAGMADLKTTEAAA